MKVWGLLVTPARVRTGVLVTKASVLNERIKAKSKLEGIVSPSVGLVASERESVRVLELA